MQAVNRLFIILLVLVPFITACASRSQSSYYNSEVGSEMSVENVHIISSRMVKIDGLNDKNRPGWGAAVGATVAGAGAYGITRSDNPAGTALTIIALVGGAIAGQFLDEKAKSSLGVEYILRKQNGEHTAVVQTVKSAKDRLPAGTNALLIHSADGYVRVSPQ